MSRVHRSIRGLVAASLSGAILLATTSGVIAEDSHDAGGDEAVATELIVWLEDPDDFDAEDLVDLGPFDIEVIAADRGLAVLDTLAAHDRIFLLGAEEVLDEGDIKKLFHKDDRIRYAEPNYEGGSADGNRFHAWPAAGPYELVEDEAADLAELIPVHQQATGDGVVVAILDTGIDGDHPILVDRIETGWDFVDDDADPDDEATGLDRDGDGLVDEAWGHGTHVAGIVAQVAPDARLMPYRVLDSDGTGRVFAVAAAIFDAVDSGADVINLSFGIDHRSKSKMLKEALKYAKKADVVVVAAAGNEGDDHRRYPAAEKDVLSVGAVDEASQHLAAFANHGDWVDVGAPGISILSALPDGRLGRWSGSSMAAPFVSAQAALLVDLAPDEDAKKVSNAIRKSCRKLSPGPSKAKVKHGAIDIMLSFDELS